MTSISPVIPIESTCRRPRRWFARRCGFFVGFALAGVGWGAASDVVPPLPAAAAALVGAGEDFPRAPTTWLEAQVELSRRGFSGGPIDGLAGPQSTAALRAFQRREGLSETGVLDAATREVLVLEAPALTWASLSAEDLAGLRPVPETWQGKAAAEGLPHATPLELLAERPGLRAPEAHVLLRGPPGGSAVVAHLARRPVAALAALLEERRCSVASLTLRLPTALLSDEDAAALSELLVSPAAASLRALDLSSCVRTAAAAAALARAIARAPNIRFVRVGDSEANLQDDGFAELWGLQLGTADRAPVEMEFDSDDSSVLTDEEEEEEEEEQDVFELSDDDDYDDDEDDFDAFGDEGDEEGAWGE
jgi:hypothetical protein